jgi:hypothetical protein
MKSFGFVVGMSIVGAMAMFSTQARAQMTCSLCDANYAACIAAGGNSSTCWTLKQCNNPTCPPPLTREAHKATAAADPRGMKEERIALVASR